MVLNRQSEAKVNIPATVAFTRKLARLLGIEARRFNVCFVDDDQIRALNTTHRHKPGATDVLSFPWNPGGAPDGETGGESDPDGEFDGFLGEVIISAETARRNAEAEGHPADTEINWLIVHGLLHLL